MYIYLSSNYYRKNDRKLTTTNFKKNIKRTRPTLIYLQYNVKNALSYIRKRKRKTG